jgi:hypothetical protein
MNTLQLLDYLQRIYVNKAALIKIKGTPEYNEEQYNQLMIFYNGKLEELRTRVQNQDAEALLQFDTDRANAIELTDGIVLVSEGTLI